ncbi:type II secretion system secretin GspD [Methylorubrum extorquens]|uniref:type II secretion system secretin GspD n=1 Tax=Methylorubrum extorquens TaxID=408 RepID=UPI00223759E2|nr:type II secretion system secretin GspD [Methylorubrum extorquens]UYW26372.1 type II secretion system secretin GspD [Methylorubrum extorquens]UYW33886.1 type II secretion system secretin GspD [Methylorubrum extorquens]
MAIRAHVLALTFGLALGPSGAAFAAEPLPGPGYGPRPSGGFILRGNDRFIAGEAPVAQALPGGLVSLNLVEAPLPNAAKAVLADTLGLGYTLDPQATGTVTLQTGGAVTREALLQMFEAALASRGLVLRRRGRIAQIAPAATDPNAVRAVRGPAAEAGAVAVPLRWVSAVEMQAILTSVAPRDVVLRADRARNLLILNGDATQIRALRQTIEMFDVDWMRGMSTAMLPVRSASPVTLARDMTQMFGGEAAGTGDVIRFIPNEALSAILVVSSRAVYLDRARVMLEQMEVLAAERERQLFVYRIQNRSARELAAVLQGVVAAETGAPVNVSSGSGAAQAGLGGGFAQGAGAMAGGFAPGYGGPGGSGYGGLSGPAGQSGAGAPYGAGYGTEAAMGGAGGTGAYGSTGSMSGTGSAGGMSPMGGMDGTGGLTAAYGAAPAVYGGGYGAEAGMAGGYGGAYGARRDAIGVVADEANNSLVISATRNQYDKILRILGRLDAMPTQVLLETVIAEVTLNNELQFGVQWFLKNSGSRFNLAQADTNRSVAQGTSGTDALIKAAVRGVPGFNYLLNASDFNVVLNALQGVTRVNVISSPNITVLDNRTAKLQVGDQVPIVRQSGQSAFAAGAPILNQIEMKDTGVILSVTPRVNKNGLVVLDINQEVSDVVKTTTSEINSPTIRQRRVATSVAVNDGHSLAIGGMVQEKAQITNESVPVLGDLPIVGPAFRNRIDGRVRTELIVFIRPKVIRGTVEADRIAEDFRQQFRAMMPIRPVPAPLPMAAMPIGPDGVLRRMID